VLVDDDATYVLAIHHVLVTLVDLVEGVTLGDQLIQLDVAGLPEAQDHRDVVQRVRAAEQRAAAMDLAPYGIRVNSFSPTAPRPDNPELLAHWRAEGRTELRPPRREPADRPSWWRPAGTFDVRRNIPMGEPATPTDIGHCVAWMCSDYARLITGCDFVVDGGARAKYWAYTPRRTTPGRCR
jgi:NAD(P)-dependent dehydrogenase (short-subunit alcohol dehydrogenase family)